MSLYGRVLYRGMAEAESMATALSRSPLYVRGGHLHALEKLFVAHSIHRQEDIYDLSCSMAQRSGGLTGLLVQGLPRR